MTSIKEYAISHTKFYRGYKAEDRFPIMTKLDYSHNYDQICSDEYLNQPVHVSSTSGSTGIPFSVIQDIHKRNRTIADLKVFGEYANYPSHECMIYLRALSGIKIDLEKDREENIYRFDISNLSHERLDELIGMINELQPTIIFGYASAMEELAKYLLSGHSPQLLVRPRSVMTCSELLTPEVGHILKMAFGCPIFDRYSNMEMGIIAQREFGKTNFKINKASYYVEILRMNADEPVNEGEVGRIVITDLFNHAFPMIRYDTGDLGSFVLNQGEFELKEVLGRRIDSLYNAVGELVSPHGISKIMWDIKNIVQWQLVQKDMGKFVLKLNADGCVDIENVTGRLISVLGAGVDIKIEYVNEIPVVASGKRKYIVNEYNYDERSGNN